MKQTTYAPSGGHEIQASQVSTEDAGGRRSVLLELAVNELAENRLWRIELGKYVGKSV